MYKNFEIYEISIHIFEEEAFISVKTTRVVSPNVTENVTW